MILLSVIVKTLVATMIKEISGDLWEYYDKGYWIGITTNGEVNRLGQAIMGKGIALEARQRFPNLPVALGIKLRSEGNKVHVFSSIRLATFPTKHNWRDDSDLDLIKESGSALMQEIWRKEVGAPFILPRPGCGNGNKNWEREVKPILATVIDEDVWVIARKQ